MTPAELEKQISKSHFHPAYLLYGEEEFLLERGMKRLVHALLADGDPAFNHHTFWMGEYKETKKIVPEIVAAANAFPFLAARRVVVVRDAEKLYTDETLLRYLHNPSPACALILVAAGTPASRRKRPAKATATAANVHALLSSSDNPWHADTAVEFKPLSPNVLTAWIADEFSARGKRISPELCALLQEIKGSDIREISSEIEKLQSAFPGTTEVTEAELDELLGESKQYNPFKLAEAVVRQDGAAAQAILRKLLDTEDRRWIVSTLVKELGALWQIKSNPVRGFVSDTDARAVGLPGIWKYKQLRDALPNIRRPDYFETCFMALAEADRDMKSTSTDDRIILTRLIHQLTR